MPRSPAFVLALAACAACTPEPPPTEAGTMPTRAAVACESLRGAHFRTVLANYPAGLGPDGVLTGRYYLNFDSSGQSYEYNREDFTMRGSCNCKENVLRVQVSGLNTSISASLDPLTGILTWEGMEFERVK